MAQWFYGQIPIAFYRLQWLYLFHDTTNNRGVLWNNNVFGIDYNGITNIRPIYFLWEGGTVMNVLFTVLGERRAGDPPGLWQNLSISGLWEGCEIIFVELNKCFLKLANFHPAVTSWHFDKLHWGITWKCHLSITIVFGVGAQEATCGVLIYWEMVPNKFLFVSVYPTRKGIIWGKWWHPTYQIRKVVCVCVHTFHIQTEDLQQMENNAIPLVVLNDRGEQGRKR